MGFKGGARPGAGRKKGQLSKEGQKRRDIAAAALDNGLTPLQFMLDELRRVTPIPKGTSDKDAEEISKADQIRRMDAAKAAAPMIHPRLSAITVDANLNVQVAAMIQASRKRAKVGD